MGVGVSCFYDTKPEQNHQGAPKPPSLYGKYNNFGYLLLYLFLSFVVFVLSVLLLGSR